jgi:ubiquinol-cytochrome c reductase cytochrome b subunit
MTLKKFFLFHYLMPMVLLYIMFVHISLIHYVRNTTRVPAQHFVSKSKSSSLYPDFIEKDILTYIVVSMVFIYFVCFNPFYFDNPVNNIPRNALSTPKHIVPEWYFLPFYLVLKLISIK